MLRHPTQWKTKDDPATAGQLDCLTSLAGSAHASDIADRALAGEFTKAEASLQIRAFLGTSSGQDS